MSAINFQDIVLYPSPIVQAAEIFASFNPRSFKVVQNHASSSMNAKAIKGLSTWENTLIKISQIVLFPLTILAVIFKAIWRWTHPVYLEKATNDSFASSKKSQDEQLPDSHKECDTPERNPLKFEDIDTEPNTTEGRQASETTNLNKFFKPNQTDTFLLTRKASSQVTKSQTNFDLDFPSLSTQTSSIHNIEPSIACSSNSSYARAIFSMIGLATLVNSISKVVFAEARVCIFSNVHNQTASELLQPNSRLLFSLKFKPQLTEDSAILSNDPKKFLAFSQSSLPLLTDSTPTFSPSIISSNFNTNCLIEEILPDFESTQVMGAMISDQPMDGQDSSQLLPTNRRDTPSQTQIITNSKQRKIDGFSLASLLHPFIKTVKLSSNAQWLHLAISTENERLILSFKLDPTIYQPRKSSTPRIELLDACEEDTLSQTLATRFKQHRIGLLTEPSLAKSSTTHSLVTSHQVLKNSISTKTPVPNHSKNALAHFPEQQLSLVHASKFPERNLHLPLGSLQASNTRKLLLEHKLGQIHVNHALSEQKTSSLTIVQAHRLYKSSKQAFAVFQAIQKRNHDDMLLWEQSSLINRCCKIMFSTLEEAIFTPFLRKIAQKFVFSLDLAPQADYLTKLEDLRQRVSRAINDQRSIKVADQEIAENIYRLPLLHAAKTILDKILTKSQHSYLSQILEEDFKKIKLSEDRSLQMGTARKQVRKLGAKLNYFDPHAQGNMPFLAGRRCISGQWVDILRHPVPTVESLESSLPYLLFTEVHIAPEYIAFLANAQRKQRPIFYNCLLDPKVKDEKIRIEKLLELSRGPFAGTFHFARFPLDGALTNVDNFKSLDDFKNAIGAAIESSVPSPSEVADDGFVVVVSRKFVHKAGQSDMDFIFSSEVANVVATHYERIIDWAFEKINNCNLEDTEKKKAFLCLVCTALKDRILSDLRISSYNNTCKDAIDRGAVHLACDLIWQNLLSNTLMNDETIEWTRVLTHWPAFMAKTQRILSNRATWIIAFAKWAEQQEPFQIRSSYDHKLGVQIDQPVEFNLNDVSMDLSYDLDYYSQENIKNLKSDFSYEIYPMNSAEEVTKQFIRDLARNNITVDPLLGLDAQALLGDDDLPASHPLDISKEERHILRQMASQTVLSYAFNELNRCYENLPIFAPDEKYTVLIHYDEPTQRWTVTHQQACFCVRDLNSGQKLARITTDITFSFEASKLPNLTSDSSPQMDKAVIHATFEKLGVN